MEVKLFDAATTTGTSLNVGILAHNASMDAAGSRRATGFHFALNDVPVSGSAVVNLYGGEIRGLLEQVTIDSSGLVNNDSEQLKVGTTWTESDILGLILNSAPYGKVSAEIISHTLENGSAESVGVTLTVVFQ